MGVRIVNAPQQEHPDVAVTAAELHPEKVVVNVLSIERSPGKEDELPDESEMGTPPKLSDDVGTDYTLAGGGGSGDGAVRRWALDFRPRVPAEATVITVTILDVTSIDIPL